jgi:DNA polymerase-4
MINPQKKNIAHLDLDCFFVSVERIQDPSLIGKPLVVGGTPSGRGVVASASYEARAFGVRSAMPTGQALRRCPQLIVVRGHYHLYSDYSDRLYHRLQDFTPVVERASIDEMYLDFTGTESLYHHDLPAIIRKLQELVASEFSLPCTISLASSKTIAKIATDHVKPNGIAVIPHGTEKEFLAPLPIGVIPGVGKVTEAALHRRGFRTVSDMQYLSVEEFTRLLGKHGVWLHRVVNGGGSETVIRHYERKSIGKEETFAHDTAEPSQLEKILFDLVESVCSRLRAKHWKTRTVTLKLRYSDFKTITRAETIKATNDDPVVFSTVRELLGQGYTRKLPLRLLGVQLSHFVDEKDPEPELFPSDDRRAHILAAVEKIRGKFGEDSIHVGGVSSGRDRGG